MLTPNSNDDARGGRNEFLLDNTYPALGNLFDLVPAPADVLIKQRRTVRGVIRGLALARCKDLNLKAVAAALSF
jgi:hypothetical protein